MDLKRGMRDKLDNYIDLSKDFDVVMEIDGSDKYRLFCMGVNGDNRIFDEEYIVFNNRTASPNNEIRYSTSGNSQIFSINLSALPETITKLIFVIMSESGSFMRNINSHTLSINQDEKNALEFRLSGADFNMEKAVIVVEVYKKETWRINAIAMGFNDGLSGLLKSYGRNTINITPPASKTVTIKPQEEAKPVEEAVTEAEPVEEAVTEAEPVEEAVTEAEPVEEAVTEAEPVEEAVTEAEQIEEPATEEAEPIEEPVTEEAEQIEEPVATEEEQPQENFYPMSQIDLGKGEKTRISRKKGNIVVNLNWKQVVGFTAKPIDLDLGCLYELKDGSKGTVQALGNKFGSLNQPPYIKLENDDRSGASVNGESLVINGEMIPQIKRILVYAFIYEGIVNWQGVDGVVTVRCPESSDIIVRLNEYNNDMTLCAIALFENEDDNLSVQKVIEFYKNQVYADEAFNWGLKWKPGKKD